MVIYDISRELFQAEVYPGDPVPEYRRVKEIEKGDVCNLSVLTAGAHSATHIDAPFHFYRDGKTIESIDLRKCIGDCLVLEYTGEISVHDLENRLKSIPLKKILIKGDVEISEEAAQLMAKYDIELLGVEKFTVGTPDTSSSIHKILLGKEIVIVEALDLTDISEGTYFLAAAPIKYDNLDGAPCRAVLISWEGKRD